MSSKPSKQSISKTIAKDMLTLVEICESQQKRINRLYHRQFVAFFAIAVQALYLIIML